MLAIVQNHTLLLDRRMAVQLDVCWSRTGAQKLKELLIPRNVVRL